MRQDSSASGHAQQATLGAGVQNVYFGGHGQRAEPPVSIAPPSGERSTSLPIRGRETLLAVLTAAAGRAQVWVVHGLGGCGKTRLAVEVAHQAQQRGAEVWWISAAEPSMLIAGMRALGRRLGVGEPELDHGDAADVIWQRLARQVDPWLLVIDNADDPPILAGAGTWVGDGRGWVRPVSSDVGMVLVTSRDGSEASWGPWCRRRRLASLPADEAALILADHAKHRPGLGSDDDARKLARRLGGLPLALKIAGSYLAESARVPAAFADAGLIRTYQQYYEALEQGHLGAGLGSPGGELTPDQTPGLIGSTWDLSLDLLDARQLPEARRLLRLMAALADAPVPYQLLLHADTMSASPLFAGLTGARLWQALQALDGFGLIDLDTDDDDAADGGAASVVRLHPLVRDTSAPRPETPGGARAAYLDLAARLLQRAAKQGTGVPEDPLMWPVWQLLTPHALEVFAMVEAEPDCQADTALAAADAAELAARYRAEQRQHTEAEMVLSKVAAIQEAHLGTDHPRTLDSRHELARRMVQRRDFARAYAEFRTVLAARLRVLDAHDPETLKVRHSIARTMAALGDHAGAQAEFREILAIRLELLGPDHPRTLATRHEIARTMAALDDHAGAQAEFREVLVTQVRVLGTDHLHPLGTRHEIARTMAALGDHAGAQAEFRAVLATRLELLGPDHPRTLATRYEIARTMAALGDHAAAQSEASEVLDTQLRVLGPDHPETMLTAQFMEAAPVEEESEC